MTDLTEKLGKLKQSVIDAYMHECSYRVDGDRYVYSYQQVPGEVTRPGADGAGGGVVVAIPAEYDGNPQYHPDPGTIAELKRQETERLAEAWAGIRGRIDAAIAPWLTRPLGGAFDEPVQSCRTLIAQLMGAVTQSANTFTGSGELATELNRVTLESTSFGGGALDDFKTRYIDDSVSRSTRITALSELLGQATTAEKQVWDKADGDLVRILDQFQTGFAAVASSGGGDAKLVFEVVGAAIAGAALFATAGTGTAIALAGAGILVNLGKDITSDSQPSKNESKTFDSTAAGLDAFEKALKGLSDRVHREESVICDGLKTNAANVKANAGLFQLAPAPIYRWEGGVMYADPQKNLSLARTFMPNAGATATAASKHPETITSGLLSALMHDYEAGERIAGAYDEVCTVARLVTQLLEELAWDLDRGARNLELTLLDHIQGEGANSKELNDLATQIASGTTHDGRPAGELLDSPPPPPPLRSPRGRFGIDALME